jgi:hypothetical protein
VQLVAVHIYQPGAGGVVASNLTGSNSIEKSLVDFTGASLSGAFAVRLSNSVNGALTLDGTTVQNKLDATAAVSVSATGSATVGFTVRDSDTGDTFESRFTNLFGSAISVVSGDAPGSTGKVTARVSDTKFVNAAPNGINNLELGVQQNATLDYVIRDNVFDAVAKASAIAGVINVNALDGGRFGSAMVDSIVGNTVQNIGTGSLVTQLGYIGVRVALDNTVVGVNHRVVIADNTFTNLWRQGILVSARNNATNVNVRIVNNTVGTAASPVGLSNRRGVELEAQSSAALKVEVLNNPSIVNSSTSGTSSALAIRSTGTTSQVSATVLNNTMGNANGAITTGRFRAETLGGTAASMCLDLRNNSLEDVARLYELVASSSGSFTVEGPGSAVVTGADITALNTVGNGSVTGAPTFSNGANCTSPSL